MKLLGTIQTVWGVPNLFSSLFLLCPLFSSRRGIEESDSLGEHRMAQSSDTRASRLVEGPVVTMARCLPWHNKIGLEGGQSLLAVLTQAWMAQPLLDGPEWTA